MGSLNGMYYANTRFPEPISSSPLIVFGMFIPYQSILAGLSFNSLQKDATAKVGEVGGSSRQGGGCRQCTAPAFTRNGAGAT